MGVFKKNESWRIDYYVEGRRKREKIGPSKKLAETVLKKRLVEVAEGKFLDIKKVPRITFEEMAKKYLEWSKVNKAQGSYNNDCYSLKRFKAFFDGKRLDEITPFAIEKYKRERLAKVSERTVDIDLSSGTSGTPFRRPWRGQGYLISGFTTVVTPQLLISS